MAEREVRRFGCRDEDGNAHTVVELQDLVSAATTANPRAVFRGVRFVLDGGERLDRVNETTFKTLSGKTLWRV